MRGRSDPSQFVDDFSGSHRFVMDFLVEEVLHRQPPELQALLITAGPLQALPTGAGVLGAGVGTGVLSLALAPCAPPPRRSFATSIRARPCLSVRLYHPQRCALLCARATASLTCCTSPRCPNPCRALARCSSASSQRRSPWPMRACGRPPCRVAPSAAVARAASPDSWRGGRGCCRGCRRRRDRVPRRRCGARLHAAALRDLR